MKKNLLNLFCFLFMVCLSYHLKAQSYQKFLSANNEWDVYANLIPLKPLLAQAWSSGPVYAVEDTVTGGYTYKKAFSRSEDIFMVGSKPCLLREDTLTRKVYIQSADSSNERILYDFSLVAGDSVDLLFRYDNTGTFILKSGWYKVDSTGFINTYAGIRNTWYLSNPFNTIIGVPQITWIEGVGSTISPVYLDEDFDLNFGFPNPASLYYLSLTCAFHDSVAVFHDSAWASIYSTGSFAFSGDSCIFQLIGGIKENASLQNELNINPNPMQGSSNIKFRNKVNEENQDYTFTLVDITGRKVSEVKVKGTVLNEGFNLTRNYVQNGFYLINIYEDQLLVATAKILMN